MMSELNTTAAKQTDSRTHYDRDNRASLDSVQEDVWNLFHLLEATVDVLREMPFERDGKRDEELDRVNGLTRLARDHARRIGVTIDDNFGVIERGQQEDAA